MGEPERSSVAALLRTQRQIIIDAWLAAVRNTVGTLPEGPSSALINNLPNMLDGLGDVLEGKEFAGTPFFNHGASVSPSYAAW